MADTLVGFDPNAAAGSKFSAEVIAEIGQVSPSVIAPGSVTTSKLADLGVTTPKLAAGAVTSAKIGTKAVANTNIDDLAVNTAQLATGAVTPVKTGTGVVTAQDYLGAAMAMKAVLLTAAQWAALVVKDPNTFYMITA